MKTAIITGASKGIGLSITEYLLKKNYQIYGLSRMHPETLKKQENYKARFVNLNKVNELIEVANNLKKECSAIDLFINCAGYGEFHELEQFSNQGILDLLQVNLIAPILLTRYFLPSLKKQKGKLIFIGSEADHTPHKKGTLYCASKHGLRGFVKSLRLECIHRETAVTLICPGLVNSSFYEKLDFSPGIESVNTIQTKQIVDTVEMILNLENNACIEEIHIAPMKHVVRRK